MLSLEGITVWGVLALIVMGIWKVAIKFFSAASVKVKLLIFFTIDSFLYFNRSCHCLCN